MCAMYANARKRSSEEMLNFLSLKAKQWKFMMTAFVFFFLLFALLFLQRYIAALCIVDKFVSIALFPFARFRRWLASKYQMNWLMQSIFINLWIVKRKNIRSFFFFQYDWIVGRRERKHWCNHEYFQVSSQTGGLFWETIWRSEIVQIMFVSRMEMSGWKVDEE